MAIPTHQSVSGFIATDPQLTYTNQNLARFSVRVGVRHGRRLDDGSFEELPPTFHSLTMFGRAAERAHEQFKKHDSFLADGRVREYTYESNGQTVQGEEFVARKIGHDSARTRYEVDRTRAADRDEPAVSQSTAADTTHAGPSDGQPGETANAEPAAESEPPARERVSEAPLANVAGKRSGRSSAKAAAVGI